MGGRPSPTGILTIEVVHAGAPAPPAWVASLYLCGPSPRDGTRSSWRIEAVDLLRHYWSGPGLLTVFLPEATDSGSEPAFEAQVDWEEDAMLCSDVIAFYIPRDMARFPGLITNVKWGRWYASGRAVLGSPPEAVRNEYLRLLAKRSGVPVSDSVVGTVRAALDAVGAGHLRRGVERRVPVAIWRTGAFQRWYVEARDAGERLLAVTVLWFARTADAEEPSWGLLVETAATALAASVPKLVLSTNGQLTVLPTMSHERPVR